MPPTDLALKTAQVSDAAALSRLHAEAFAAQGQAPWAPKTFADLLALPETRSLVAPGPGGIRGFILGRSSGEEAEILTLATAPAERRQGLATALLTALTEAFRADGVACLYLEVMEGNDAALALYAAAGFRPVGKRPNYYQDIRNNEKHAALILRNAI